MKALVQRVIQAQVKIQGKEKAAQIGAGLVIFLGIGKQDGALQAAHLAQKTAHLRIFSNPEGKFDRSLLDTGGEALVISQFTLYGDTSKGRRPDFTQAAAAEDAKPLYEEFIRRLRAAGISHVAEGEFQAHMQVTLTNDGPVTVLLEA